METDRDEKKAGVIFYLNQIGLEAVIEVIHTRLSYRFVSSKSTFVIWNCTKTCVASNNQQNNLVHAQELRIKKQLQSKEGQGQVSARLILTTVQYLSKANIFNF